MRKAVYSGKFAVWNTEKKKHDGSDRMKEMILICRKISLLSKNTARVYFVKGGILTAKAKKGLTIFSIFHKRMI